MSSFLGICFGHDFIQACQVQCPQRASAGPIAIFSNGRRALNLPLAPARQSGAPSPTPVNREPKCPLPARFHAHHSVAEKVALKYARTFRQSSPSAVTPQIVCKRPTAAGLAAIPASISALPSSSRPSLTSTTPLK